MGQCFCIHPQLSLSHFLSLSLSLTHTHTHTRVPSPQASILSTHLPTWWPEVGDSPSAHRVPQAPVHADPFSPNLLPPHQPPHLPPLILSTVSLHFSRFLSLTPVFTLVPPEAAGIPTSRWGRGGEEVGDSRSSGLLDKAKPITKNDQNSVAR